MIQLRDPESPPNSIIISSDAWAERNLRGIKKENPFASPRLNEKPSRPSTLSFLYFHLRRNNLIRSHPRIRHCSKFHLWKISDYNFHADDENGYAMEIYFVHTPRDSELIIIAPLAPQSIEWQSFKINLKSH